MFKELVLISMPKNENAFTKFMSQPIGRDVYINYAKNISKGYPLANSMFFLRDDFTENEAKDAFVDGWKASSRYPSSQAVQLIAKNMEQFQGPVKSDLYFNRGYESEEMFNELTSDHSKNVISLAVSHLISFNLDALSAIPKMVTFDFWTRITLPMISTFLHTRFSALNVNDPSKKTGYFFGSFFILKKKTYEEVGTHEGVKREIIEDGALGKKVKESGYKMKMVRGEHLIEAVWARDKSTLWNALKRLMIPLYLQSGKIAIGIFFAVLFLLFVPFPIFAVSILLSVETISAQILCVIAAIASILIYIGAIIEVKVGLELRLVHALFAPLGSLVVVLGFLSGLLQAKSTSSVTWRGRVYSMKDHTQNSISV